MSVTKAYIDAIAGGTVWHATLPINPVVGDCYWDRTINGSCMFDGVKWIPLSGPISEQKSLIPTNSQLEKHPSLKQSWEEYLVIRKLLGI